MLPSLRLLAHAKVNLSLEVLGRRPDGFHEIRSLMVPLGLADRLTLRLRRTAGLELRVPGAPELENAENLASRAARAFAAAFGLPGLSILLEKRIPIAAGLGGGSSDAAAVLRGLARLRQIDPRRLTPLAEALGSDVPFFLSERPAFVTGRGETLAPAPPLPRLHLLIVKPPFGIAAREAYGAWRAPTLTHKGLDARSEDSCHRRWRAIRSAADVGKLLVNDLQPGCARLKPDLRDLLGRLGALGAPGVLMSGSGSVCFALFSSARALWAARARFRAAGDEKVIVARALAGPTRATRGTFNL